jgi:hypothetical protein
MKTFPADHVPTTKSLKQIYIMNRCTKDAICSIIIVTIEFQKKSRLLLGGRYK